MKKSSDEKYGFFQRLKNNMQDFYLKFKTIIKVILIIILILSLLIIMFNLTYNLHFYKNPKISIEPTQVYKTLKNNESEDINFSINSKTNFLCKSVCEYEFIDRGASKIIKNKTLDNNNQVNVTISGPNAGSGVLVYNLDVTCYNKKTLFCPYDSLNETSKKSSFVVLSYDLTDNEKSAKEKIRPKLLLLIEQLNFVSEKQENINSVIENESIEFFNKNQIKSEFKLLTENILDTISDTQNYYTLWEEQKYLSLSSKKIDDDMEKLQTYSKDINEIESKINLNINLTNQSVSKYNLNLNQIQNFTNESNEVLKLNSLQVIINQSFTNLNQNEQELNEMLLNMSNINLNAFKLKQGEFEYNLNSFENEVLNFQKNISDIKTQILKEEYDARCLIGYCPIYTANFCNNIKNIMQNESFNKYELKNELYLLNNTYYDTFGLLDDCENARNKSCIFNQTIYIKYISENETLNLNLSQINIIKLNKTIYEINQREILIKPNPVLINISLNLCEHNNNKFVTNFSTFQYINHQLAFNNTQKELFKTELIEHLPICCQNGICASCCTTSECKNDEKTYPLILVHGHSFLRSSPADPISDMFNKIEFQLIQDGYIDGGTLEFENNESLNKDWSYLNLPLVLKTNYYYENYYDVGSYVYIVKKDENIDNYAIRLSENIENIKKMTGRPKVNIVAHSMGGLVVRRYIQIFGENSVNKIILIGVPNKGVEGRVEYLCSVVGEKLECEDMKSNSILISKLNDPTYKPKNVKIYTISGSGCDTSGKDGDGIVTLNSSQIPYAKKSFIINGTCQDILKTELHAKLLDIDKYPEVYEDLIEVLNE